MRTQSLRIATFFAFLSFLLLATFASAQTPLITSVSPTSGPINALVTIAGSNFGATQGKSTVTFGGVSAGITSWSASSIVAQVPSSAPLGSVNVQVWVNTAASNAVPFTVLPTPTETQLSINAGSVGDLITVTGTNFGSTQGNSTVTFNGTVASPTSWSNTSISVPVPVGATTGNLLMTVNGVPADQGGIAFMVVPPAPIGVGFVQGNYFAIQSSSLPSSVQTVSLRYPIPQTQGDLNAIVIGWRDTKYQIQSVTDSAGNTYAVAAPLVSLSGFGRQAIYYAKDILPSASNTVTVTFTGTAHLPDIRIAEYKGLDTSSPLDVTHGASATSGTLSNSGNVTTTNADDVLVGANLVDSNINTTAAGADYTARVLTTPRFDIYEDRIVTAIGSYNATAPMNKSGNWIAQMVAFKESPNQAPVVNAGPNQTITLPTNTVTLNGTVTDDGLPNNTLTISWSQISGPSGVTFSSPDTAVTQATFPGAGTYVLQLSASDGQLSSSATVTITVSGSNALTLNPLAAGPDVTGTTQTMTAVLKSGTGPTSTPISGVSVSFTVTGPNATTGSATTNSTGTATFTYTGSSSGTDTVTASYAGQSSNSANVSWLVPAQPISSSTVTGRFFFAPELPNCICGGWPNIAETWSPTDQFAFQQQFPSITFNPPGGVVTGNTAANTGTRPFTDVTTDLNANFTGAIVAQGNGYQAGLGTLFSFKAVFTGTLTVASTGNQTLYFVGDDGWVFGMGNGATLVSGTLVSPPASGVMPFTNYPVVAAYNHGTGPFFNPVVINFPAPGTYPYELDYYECCGGELSMTITTQVNTPGGGSFNGGLPPSGVLSLTPTNPASLATGQSQTFTVLATSASGTVLQNAAVTLIANGANQRQLTATTDSTGHATFQYTGTNAGTDTVQVSANVSGMGTYSNLVNQTWTVAAGSGAVTFTPQGWIGSPAIGTVVQGQVPITIASGVNLTSGTLTYWPTSNPAAITTLNANTTGSGTIGTFDATRLASGGYTIQLNATANGSTQVSQTTVSVVGDNKPGRMKSTVTEFKVPLAGIPISITRTYDSLDKSKIEDFGYGWKLGTFVDLSVDAQSNVTLNFNGQKITFYFTPQSVFFGIPWLAPSYTPQAGVHGSLKSDGCGGLLRVGTSLVCFPNTGQTYQPTLYAYTDPVGRTYTMTATGQLLSIQDLNGNTITVTPTGITSSVGGANVTFVRDGTGRITDIYDTNQNHYQYSYDPSSGELASVQYPGITTPETYVYDTPTQDCPTSPSTCVHLLKSETDPRGNSSSATYYADGRLKSVTGPSVPDPSGNPGNVQFTTQYSYNLSTNTTTTTNPDGGTVTRTDDSFGNPLTITEQVNGGTSRTTTYQYDSSENLIKVIRPCGNASCSDSSGNDTWLYTYDGNGFQTSVQAPSLPADSKTYNQFGGITSQTDAANTNTITTTYDSNFNPSQVTDKLNGTGGSPVATYSNYDAMGNFADSTDANGKATHYDYYQTGPSTGYLQDVIRTNGSVQEKTSYTYDPMGKVLTMTDACGNGSCPDMTVGTSHTTTYTYDQLERLSTVTDAAGFVTKYLYDNNSNKTDQYDAFGTGLQRHTVYQYDNLNRQTQITYPDNTTKQVVYDFRGNKTVEIDQLGHKTVYAYDLAGQLTSVTYAAGTSDAGTVSYTYDLDGRQQTVTDENNNAQNTGLHTTNTYEAAGRLISMQDSLGNVTSFGYDADNRKTSVTDPNNQAAHVSTTYLYDPRGRLLTITYPATATQPITTMQYTYDGMGRVKSSLDQNNAPTNKTYDDVGRLISVTDAIGNLTQYQYDLNGNLKTLIDANTHQTQYQYDTMNRRVHRILPLNQIEDYSYDALGRLATKRDFNRKMTTYNYDSMDRILSKVPDPSLGQPTNSFTYTVGGLLCAASGQRCSMTDPSGTTSFAYDNRDRVKTKNTPEGILNYIYDAHGNVTSIVSSNTNGASMSYSYDAVNRLSQVCDKRLDGTCAPNGPGITTYSYDASGNLFGYSYPNTVKTSNVFDPLNRLTQTCSATSTPACSAGTKLSSYLYGLRSEGNRANVTELNGRFVGYQYDNDYRLIQESISSDPAGNNGIVSYPAQNSQPQPGYDAVGNRLFMTSTLNAVPGGSFFYDNNDRLTTDSYDANGNTKSFAGTTINYDFENRMTQYGANVLLTYDGDGNRVSETAAGVTTKFLVDDKNPTGLPQVQDELVNGSVTRTYAYGLQRISENQLVGGTWTPSFYGYDGHGNVRFLTNSAGTITDSYDFDAFGMPIKTSGTTPNQFLYSGERSDSSISLYDLRARYYNQATGRFWARDPIEGRKCCGLSWNPYIYVRQNPANRTDPTGRMLIESGSSFQFWTGVVFGLTYLGVEITKEFVCEGHEAASAVPGVKLPPLPPGVPPIPPPLSFLPGGGGLTIGRPHPPPTPLPDFPNGEPPAPCSIPHVGRPVPGTPTPGPPDWPKNGGWPGQRGPDEGGQEAD